MAGFLAVSGGRENPCRADTSSPVSSHDESSRNKNSRESCPEARVSASKLASALWGACPAQAYCDVYIEYFSLQIFEIKYIFHLHYKKKSIYRNQIKLEI